MEHAQSILLLGPPPIESNAAYVLNNTIPYLILLLNYVLFQLLRSLANKFFPKSQVSSSGKARLARLLIEELISTCELCADCAELNVVYEKHGSLAYGVALFFLSYVWIGAFGDAHTTPAYLAEDYFLDKGSALFKTGDTYARFIGQSLAMPLAWRVATVYWKYHLLSEHSSMLKVEDCRSSLTTSSLNGFMIESICCFISRLTELFGHKLQQQGYMTRRAISVICSFICSLLVVMALDLSGGYFNPVLAASLEYGCKGIEWHQHALVFWLGPMAGHVLARAMYRHFMGNEESPQRPNLERQKSQQKRNTSSSQRKLTEQAQPTKAARTSPRKKSRLDKID